MPEPLCLAARFVRAGRTLLAACLLAGGAVAAQAGTAESVSFSHLDWELACDNTRTCRAAGYSADTANMPVSVLLTRPAGAAAEVTAKVQTGSYSDADPQCPRQLRLSGAGQGSGAIALKDCMGVLKPAHIAALLNAAKTDSAIAFADGGREWALSLQGAQAVLLKMDEAQGRLHTPTALVRKGTRPASGVLPPLATPVIRVPPLPVARPQDKALLPRIAAALRATQPENCPMLTSDDASDDTGPRLEARLSDTQLLVSALCWRAAYNEGHGFWVVQGQPPHAATLVTDMGTGYADGYGQGEISYSHKGRGLGDCWGSGAWAWNGKAFVTSSESATGMCRLIAPGGAWTLPTFVSRVVREP